MSSTDITTAADLPGLYQWIGPNLVSSRMNARRSSCAGPNCQSSMLKFPGLRRHARAIAQLKPRHMTNIFRTAIHGSRNLRFDESGMKFLTIAWSDGPREADCLRLLNQTQNWAAPAALW